MKRFLTGLLAAALALGLCACSGEDEGAGVPPAESVVQMQAGVVDWTKEPEAVVEVSKAEEPEVEEPKVEEPKVEEPKVEEPKVEEPKVKEPKVEEPKVEEPKVEAPKAEEPKTEQPKVEQPAAKEPVVEKPKETTTPKAQEQKPAQTQPSVSATEETARDYVLNTNTKKFHYPTCSSAKSIKEKNRAEFQGTRSEAIAKGYDPCGRCHP